MPITTKTRKAPAKTKAPAAPPKAAPAAARADVCPKCGETLVTAEGAAPRCRVCSPLTGTYKAGPDGRIVRVSQDIPSVSKGSSPSFPSAEDCGEGACGMPSPGGPCGGGGCC